MPRRIKIARRGLDSSVLQIALHPLQLDRGLVASAWLESRHCKAAAGGNVRGVEDEGWRHTFGVPKIRHRHLERIGHVREALAPGGFEHAVQYLAAVELGDRHRNEALEEVREQRCCDDRGQIVPVQNRIDVLFQRTWTLTERLAVRYRFLARY